MWKIKFTPLFFLTYCKDTTNLLHWVLAACLARTSKSDTSCLYKTLTFIMMQKIIFIPNLFLNYYKELQPCYFGYLGHAWSRLPKELKELSLVLGKTNDKIFQKIQNTLFLGPFCLNLGKNEFSTKIGLHHFLASVPSFMQKIRKN